MAANRAWDIDSLDGHEFELLVMRLLKEMGLQVEETKRTGDGGIDAIARSEELITGGVFVIQCKRYSSNVGVSQVRELYGVVNHVNASKGILITNSSFTRQAKDFARGKPIELISGDMLRALLLEHGVEGAIPEGKTLAVFPESHKRLWEGLLRIAERVESELEVSSLVISPRAKKYDSQAFLKEVDETLRVFEVSMENFSRVGADIAGRSVNVMSSRYVDSRLRVMRSIVDDVLRCRQAVADARVESRYVPLKDALVELLAAPMRQFASFVKDAYPKVEELDGKLVDKDSLFQPTLTVDVSEQMGNFQRELKRLTRKSFWRRVFG